MDERERPEPGPNAERQANARDRRLAEALRSNLQKRKAQIRARRSGEADERPSGLGASGEGGPDDR